jgi:hypothetical protein
MRYIGVNSYTKISEQSTGVYLHDIPWSDPSSQAHRQQCSMSLQLQKYLWASHQSTPAIEVHCASQASRSSSSAHSPHRIENSPTESAPSRCCPQAGSIRECRQDALPDPLHAQSHIRRFSLAWLGGHQCARAAFRVCVSKFDFVGQLLVRKNGWVPGIRHATFVRAELNLKPEQRETILRCQVTYNRDASRLEDF